MSITSDAQCLLHDGHSSGHAGSINSVMCSIPIPTDVLIMFSWVIPYNARVNEK